MNISVKIICTILQLFIYTFCFLNLSAQEKESSEIPEGYFAEKDVVYSQVDGIDLKLDIYYTRRTDNPLPLVIWVHGGGWRGGDKRNIRLAGELLEEGYAVASINYRLSGQATFPAQIIDCKAAVRWLRANARKYNVDPYKFAAWGSSAGGHLVALLGTAEDKFEWEQGDYLEYSSSVQAVVDWYGPTDFTRMNDIKGKKDHFAPDSPESRLIGGAVPDNPEKVQNANPVNYITKKTPPFQIYHGKNDSMVLPNQAEIIHEALKAQGHEPDFAILENMRHGGKEWNKYVPNVKLFLDKHLNSHTLEKQEKPEVGSITWVYRYMEIAPLLEYKTFYSESVDNDYGYMLYLPPGYDKNPDKRYPVIYWLPGKKGNPSVVAAYVDLYNDAILQKKAPEAIIIGVNALRGSMYTNEKDGKRLVESVIIKDLIPHVDRTYRTINDRSMRAIDGFSMGGYGAFRLGFKYIDMFGAISGIAAAIHKPEQISQSRSEIFETIFHGDIEYTIEQSPWTITQENARTLKKRSKKDTHIRLYVGEEDRLLEKNISFHELLDSLDIKHSFGIIKNAGHNYSKVYANWEGNPFDFYLKAFSNKNKD